MVLLCQYVWRQRWEIATLFLISSDLFLDINNVDDTSRPPPYTSITSITSESKRFSLLSALSGVWSRCVSYMHDVDIWSWRLLSEIAEWRTGWCHRPIAKACWDAQVSEDEWVGLRGRVDGGFTVGWGCGVLFIDMLEVSRYSVFMQNQWRGCLCWWDLSHVLSQNGHCSEKRRGVLEDQFIAFSDMYLRMFPGSSLEYMWVLDSCFMRRNRLV